MPGERWINERSKSVFHLREYKLSIISSFQREGEDREEIGVVVDRLELLQLKPTTSLINKIQIIRHIGWTINNSR